MKKTFAVLFLISFLAVLLAPIITSAQIATQCDIRRAIVVDASTTCPVGVITEASSTFGICCLLNTIYKVADIIFAILLVFSVLMILVAAFTFITAGGAPEKVNKARDYILFALVGLIVAFLARAIPGIVKMLVT